MKNRIKLIEKLVREMFPHDLERRNKVYDALLEEFAAGQQERMALCIELREGFKQRGLWFPDNNGSDVIVAVFRALDGPEKPDDTKEV